MNNDRSLNEMTTENKKISITCYSVERIRLNVQRVRKKTSDFDISEDEHSEGTDEKVAEGRLTGSETSVEEAKSTKLLEV